MDGAVRRPRREGYAPPASAKQAGRPKSPSASVIGASRAIAKHGDPHASGLAASHQRNAVQQRTAKPSIGNALEIHGDVKPQFVSANEFNTEHATASGVMRDDAAHLVQTPSAHMKIITPVTHSSPTPRPAAAKSRPASALVPASDSEQTSVAAAASARIEEVAAETRQLMQESIAANQTILDQITQRRKRAEALSNLYRMETQESIRDMAQVEEDVRELQAKRKWLVDVTRSLELQVYQEQRRFSSKHSEKKAHAVPSPSHTPRVSAHATTGREGAIQVVRNEYESLNRRLDSAKSILDNLKSDSDRLTSQFDGRQRERTALAAMSEALTKEVTDLERHELVVSGIVRESKDAIRKSGTYASRMPYLKKYADSLEEIIAATRDDFQTAQKILSTIMESDENSIAELRRVTSLSPAQQNVLPSLVRQLQTENELLQRLAHVHVEDAERERGELGRTAEKLQGRLKDVEEKIRSLASKGKALSSM